MGFIFRSTQNTRPIFHDSLKFIRSDVPTAVSQEEATWLIEHDITTIVDLRTDAERERKNCPLSADERFHYYCMPVTGGDIVPRSVDAVSESYIKMVDENLYRTIDLMQTAPTNVLYFCNAGKDRTGVISAILLRNAGASTEYIVADYMKSKDNLKTMLNAYARQNPEIDINIITPNEKYIKDFLRWYDTYLL